MFFTRRGDDGFTDLIGGPRQAKDSLRIAALGDIDEASSAIGVARASVRGDDTRAALLHVQKDLYLLMADIAAVAGKGAENHRLGSAQIEGIEDVIRTFDPKISVPKEFVAPGDTLAGATLDLARAIVRRAERTVTHLLHEGEGATAEMFQYLNLLSSLLFGLARYEDSLAGVTPTISKQFDE